MVINGSGGWGDGFPALWFSEYLYSKDPNLLIDLYAGGNAESALTLPLKVRYEVLRHLYPQIYKLPSSLNKEKIEALDEYRRFFKKDKIKKVLSLINKEPFHHSNSIKKPRFIKKWLMKPPSPNAYDSILVTHHNHSATENSWASPPSRDNLLNGLLPPMSYWRSSVDLPDKIRMDLNADLLNILFHENFRPSMPVLKEPILRELSELPNKYISIQTRSEDSGPLDIDGPNRNNISGQEYGEWLDSFIKKVSIKWGLPILFTSGFLKKYERMGECIDATRLSLWAKIELHRRAKYSYVAHSGFGMIIAIYRNLEDVKLLNICKEGIYRNPPILLFSNVKNLKPDQSFTGSPPGWVDQYRNWEINIEDSMEP